MIPLMDDLFMADFELEEEPSKSYKLNLSGSNIVGQVDNLEAVKQAIYKILHTERYAYVIYSWDYGVEFTDLLGEPFTYVCPELIRRIGEALTQDTRIQSVDNFEFEERKHAVWLSFTAHTIYGDTDTEMEVAF